MAQILLRDATIIRTAVVQRWRWSSDEKKSLKLKKKPSLNRKNSKYEKGKIPGEKKTNQDTRKYTMFGDVSIIHDN